MTTATATTRHEQAGEALGDLRRIFYEPSAFGLSVNLADVAATVEAEFTSGPFRDDEIARRVRAMVHADAADDAKVARRHLLAVLAKASKAHGIEPLDSVPLIPDAS